MISRSLNQLGHSGMHGSLYILFVFHLTGQVSNDACLDFFPEFRITDFLGKKARAKKNDLFAPKCFDSEAADLEKKFQKLG